MKSVFYLFVFIFLVPLNVIAVSFSADAVQLRKGEFSHARIYWTDERVRFEYLDKGVAVAQIYDTLNKKIIWLDTENKVFLERKLSDDQAKQKMVNKSAFIKNPCDLFADAQCTRLKEAVVNGRTTIKWLMTLDIEGSDTHIFQWVDKKYGVVIKQENSDGSVLNATIEDELEVNGRKTRKVDMYAVSKIGTSMQNVQWYDSELDIVIRQVFADGAMDELRNIKVESIASSLFEIPEGYSEVETPIQNKSKMASQPEALTLSETQNN